MDKSTICLNMIVKDESHIIEKTLNNLIDNIDFDYWVIADTGSTDNTVDIIKNFFSKYKIPGEIKHHTWKDFAHNRNLALAEAKDKAEYTFIFDADDYINGNLELPRKLIDGAYLLKFSGFNADYFRPLLIKNSLNWQWYGVLHEFVLTGEKYNKNYYNGDYSITSGRSGNRNKDPNKYIKDAEILKNAYYKELEKDSTDKNNLLFNRYSFYCAQSYKDAEHRNEALWWYRNTTTLNTSIQEIYYSHLTAGRLLIELDRPDEAIIHWLKGQALNIGRAECYYEIAKYYRLQNNMQMACSFGILAKRVSVQPSGLFFETNIHAYLIDFELTLSAYYANEIQIGLEACQSVLKNCKNPKYIESTKNNIKFYQ